jgi:hypothetical protein
MGKKRLTKSAEFGTEFEYHCVNISKGTDECFFFEIGDTITTDICESVALMMRMGVTDSNIWNMDITKIKNLDSYDPRRCLYWLSGGDGEWIKREFYKRPWNECDLLFEEEFGFIVHMIVNKSKTLRDIKMGFMKFLNLPVFYEFCLSKNLI